MHEISFDGVKKYLGTTLIFKNITFQIIDGERVGIIGENGCGKTTILKLIAGILKLNHCAGYPYAPVPPGYDEGWVNISKYTTRAYLEQIPQYDENLKVIDVLNLSFNEVHQIEQKMRRLEEDMLNQEGTELEMTLKKYSDLIQLYEIKGGYDIEEKLSKICKGLKFDESFLSQKFNLLSGGEKTRVTLGKLLIDTPDVLLLDEPTNHLDMDSVEWLQEYIKGYKGIVVVVSHDRYFLDHVATKIIEIENKKSKTYIGNYSDYLRQKEVDTTIQYNKYREQKKKISKMEESIKELRGWAAQADNNKFFRRAASMQIKLDKMERVEKPILNKKHMKISFGTSGRSGNIVIKASGLTKSFGQKVIFEQAELLIRYGERVALIGPNGSGKTTFLRMLLGEAFPDSGEISLGANINMAYLAQNIAFENEELTVLDYFREDIAIHEGQAREHLAKFLFYGGNVYKKIKLLSGGEKVRLKLSKLLFNNVNVLILDEPTNHLDISSIESIEAALSQFKGTIFIISHDRYFINKTCERVISIENKSFVSYLGNYDYYKQARALKDTTNQRESNISSGNEIEKDSKCKKFNKENFNKKEKIVDKDLERSKLEKRIEATEFKLKEIEVSMEVNGANFEELQKLYTSKEELLRELDSLIEAWANI